MSVSLSTLIGLANKYESVSKATSKETRILLRLTSGALTLEQSPGFFHRIVHGAEYRFFPSAQQLSTLFQQTLKDLSEKEEAISKDDFEKLSHFISWFQERHEAYKKPSFFRRWFPHLFGSAHTSTEIQEIDIVAKLKTFTGRICSSTSDAAQSNEITARFQAIVGNKAERAALLSVIDQCKKLSPLSSELEQITVSLKQCGPVDDCKKKIMEELRKIQSEKKASLKNVVDEVRAAGFEITEPAFTPTDEPSDFVKELILYDTAIKKLEETARKTLASREQRTALISIREKCKEHFPTYEKELEQITVSLKSCEPVDECKQKMIGVLRKIQSEKEASLKKVVDEARAADIEITEPAFTPTDEPSTFVENLIRYDTAIKELKETARKKAIEMLTELKMMLAKLVDNGYLKERSVDIQKKIETSIEELESPEYRLPNLSEFKEVQETWRYVDSYIFGAFLPFFDRVNAIQFHDKHRLVSGEVEKARTEIWQLQHEMRFDLEKQVSFEGGIQKAGQIAESLSKLDGLRKGMKEKYDPIKREVLAAKKWLEEKIELCRSSPKFSALLEEYTQLLEEYTHLREALVQAETKVSQFGDDFEKAIEYVQWIIEQVARLQTIREHGPELRILSYSMEMQSVFQEYAMLPENEIKKSILEDWDRLDARIRPHEEMLQILEGIKLKLRIAQCHDDQERASLQGQLSEVDEKIKLWSDQRRKTCMAIRRQIEDLTWSSWRENSQAEFKEATDELTKCNQAAVTLPPNQDDQLSSIELQAKAKYDHTLHLGVNRFDRAAKYEKIKNPIALAIAQAKAFQGDAALFQEYHKWADGLQADLEKLSQLGDDFDITEKMARYKSLRIDDMLTKQFDTKRALQCMAHFATIGGFYLQLIQLPESSSRAKVLKRLAVLVNRVSEKTSEEITQELEAIKKDIDELPKR